jgi:hypothetical protein
MSIESKIPLEEVNIKDLSLDKPEGVELRFDVDKHFTPEDWQGMEAKLVYYKTHPEAFWSSFEDLAANIKQLRPNFTISEADWRGLRNDEYKRYRQIGGSENWGAIAIGLAKQKIIEPNLNLENYRESISKYMVKLMKSKDYGQFSIIGRCMKIVFPEFQKELSPAELNEIQMFKDELHMDKNSSQLLNYYWKLNSFISNFSISADERELMKTSLTEDKKKDDWFDFAQHVLQLRDLHVDVTVSRDDWHNMEQALERNKKTEGWDFAAELAVAMKKLATPPTDFKANAPALPEIKKF